MTHVQALTFMPGWTVWSSEQRVAYLPSIMPWPISGQNVLIVIGTTPSAAYGIRAPFIYRLQHHTWALVSDPALIQFTNRDYEMNTEQAHSAPQRYWLKVFSLRRGHLSQIEKRLTHKRYLGGWDFESLTPPKYIPPNDDPLQEFGLRWQWWGWNNQR